MTAGYLQCVLLVAVSFLVLHYSIESHVGVEPWGSSLSISYEPSRKHLASREECEPFLHNVTHTSWDGQCKYNLTQISCKGQCVSETVPKFYAIK